MGFVLPKRISLGGPGCGNAVPTPLHTCVSLSVPYVISSWILLLYVTQSRASAEIYCSLSPCQSPWWKPTVTGLKRRRF